MKRCNQSTDHGGPGADVPVGGDDIESRREELAALIGRLLACRWLEGLSDVDAPRPTGDG